MKISYKLRASFWFVPTVMVLAAIASASALVAIDRYAHGQPGEGQFAWFGMSEQAARDLLTAIASSMITVAGVTFSITIVTLSLASSQYSSRVLRNFLRDRGNQMVLGMFVAVYVYCLTVLSIINSDPQRAFVPPLAVCGGVLLAFCGIGFLIYFIHHTAQSIQASTIIKETAEETLRAIEHLFPGEIGNEADESHCKLPPELLGARRWQPVMARASGYIQTLDAEQLLRLTDSREMILRMHHSVGDFVVQGTPLASLHAANVTAEEVSSRIHRALVINAHRTIESDATFGIRQLVDIAMKALSPGVNDTTTANICLDYLTVILARLIQTTAPSPCRLSGGRLRIIVQGPTFSDVLGECYEQIRQNASGNVRVLGHLLYSIETIAPLAARPQRIEALRQQVELVAEMVRRTVIVPADQERLIGGCEQALTRLERLRID